MNWRIETREGSGETKTKGLVGVGEGVNMVCTRIYSMIGEG